jgi:hypothetical protein
MPARHFQVVIFCLDVFAVISLTIIGNEMVMKFCRNGMLKALPLAAASILSTAHSQDNCYEVCGFEERNTSDIGKCLQRPIDDGGQSDSAQEAMIQIYNNVEQAGIRPGGLEGEDTILIGLNAAKAGEDIANSEGLYYCLFDETSGTDAFYWVPNCNVLKQGLSNDELLCTGLTAQEQEDELVSVGYVVDATLFGDDKFNRYVFNSTKARMTETQPIEAQGFSCSGRPWFVSSTCIDPLATTCPTAFQGSSGRGAFQHYGTVNVTVVAQDVREWQLAPCLDTGETSASFTLRTSVFVSFLLCIVCIIIVRY